MLSPLFTLPFASQDGPALEIVGHGGHSGLKIGAFGPVAFGITRTVVADERGDDALDVGTLLHLLFKGLGLGVGNGLATLDDIVGEGAIPFLRFRANVPEKHRSATNSGSQSAIPRRRMANRGTHDDEIASIRARP